MSSPQPWPPGTPASWDGSPPAPPAGRRSARAAVPWLVGAALLLTVSLVLSVTADKRAVGDAAGLPTSIGEWERAGAATDDDAAAPGDDAQEDPPPPDDGDDTADTDPQGGGTEGHDVRLDAFREVAAGDCLENYDTGDGWNATVPVAGECGTDSGVMFVSSVRGDATECDAGPGLGYWAHTSEADETVALCLIRQFQEDSCVLAQQSDGEIEDANLLSVVACDADELPGDWNHTVRITAVYQAPEEMYDGACARYEGDQESYYYWLVDSERVLVCARSDEE